MSETSLEGHVHRHCGGVYEFARERVTIRASGMSAEVDRGLYRCARCGDEQRTLEQREAAEQEATAAIRREHGLLSPREIRALRNGLGLTTAQLAELVYGAPRGIIEGWERGRYIQNAEADQLLRSLADPEVLRQRAARAGLVLPTPADQSAGEETSPDDPDAQGPAERSESATSSAHPAPSEPQHRAQ
jgi:putative zinc finger/helix-turn-helix YgiT family protein